MSTRELPLLQAAEEYGPFDIVFEAGASSVTFESMQALGPNGVLVLTSIRGGGDRKIKVLGYQIMLEYVLGNKVVVGSVNANRTHFELVVQDMALVEALYPAGLKGLLTHPMKDSTTTKRCYGF